MATKILPVCKTATATAIQKARWALSPEMIGRRDEILTFWFGAAWTPLTDPDPKELPEVPSNYELWFGGSPELDAEIKKRFGADVEKAIKGEYRQWQNESPLSLLALIILFDQFSLNIYRDEPRGYEVSEMAIPLAYTALGRSWVSKLPQNMGMFMTLPLMHSELIDDQTVNKNRVPDDEFVDVHYKAVADHGRFPGRNKVMGRKNTPEEDEYIKNGGVF